jgi:hypothetical protein
MAASGLLLAAACGSSLTGPSVPTVTITSLEWLGENLDPSCWTSPPAGGQTAYYDFWIHYSGDIAFSDVEYARVYLPNGSYWTLGKDASLFHATARTIGGYGRWFDPKKPNLLPIGYLHVEIKLFDGASSTYSAYIPAPGSLTATPYTTMYSQDLALPPAESVPMLVRASVGATNTITAADQAISITFSVADPRVYDGLVWFYDAADTYLGSSTSFRDPATGSVNPPLGGALWTDGTTNTVALHAADIAFGAGASFGQIAGFRVVLVDGAQHGLQANGQPRFDGRSISARASLTPP